MQTTIRGAVEEDLPAIVRLTKENRALLARLEPVYWRPSPNADESHARFMRHVVTNPDITKRVLEKDGRVVGFVVSVERPGFWFIDDICLSRDADWSTDGVDLLSSIEERPAATTCPHRHAERLRAAGEVGLRLVSTFRLIRFDEKHPIDLDLGRDPIAPREASTDLVDAPFHIFSPAMTPEAVSVVGDESGYGVTSPSISAPPIYDPGGTTAVIDRVVGADREGVLRRTLSYTAQRGDIGAILVVGADDGELSAIADRLRAAHPVDVLMWPDGS
jgi:hypothetical protein